MVEKGFEKKKKYGKDRGFQRAVTGKVIQIIFVTVIRNILVLFFEIKDKKY
jgi:hypothetical protein